MRRGALARIAIAAALVAAAPGAARATEAPAGDDAAEVLWAEGRAAAAAALFERRWDRGGTARDGVNAVIAWRVAGRYAHARGLLARVVVRTPPEGNVLEVTRELEARLGELTVLAALVGELEPGAVVKVDGDVAERLGDALILDLGDREITIDQPRCERWVWRGEALPGGRLELPVELRCDRQGTLHVVLYHQRGGVVTIDGRDHAIGGSEADLRLPPGRHRLAVRAHGRRVADDIIEIGEGAVATHRVYYPWRAATGGWVVGLGVAGGPASTEWAAGGVAFGGWAGARWRALLGVGGGGHGGDPFAHWRFTAELAWHVLPPVWQRYALGGRLALEVDPLAVRIERTGLYRFPVLGAGETTTTIVHAGAVSLAIDFQAWHVEASVLPLGWLFVDSLWLYSIDDGYAFGAALLAGFRI